MQYIKGTREFNFFNTVVCLGKFDGIHKGHKKLIQIMKNELEPGQNSVIFTFDVPPKTIVDQTEVKNLLTTKERVEIYDGLGIDILIEYPFDSYIASMKPDEFAEKILINQLGTKKIIVGPDFRFGYKRSGSVDTLKELGKKFDFTVYVVDKEKYMNLDISSTLIKEKILRGKVRQAEEMLGYQYFLSGKVVHGEKLGQTIGFPTMNLEPDLDKILPGDGVYETQVIINGKAYKGVTNIGLRPTVSNKKNRSIETFIINYSGNLYGSKATLVFLNFIRDERKFNDLDELKNQIQIDIENIV